MRKWGTIRAAAAPGRWCAGRFAAACAVGGLLVLPALAQQSGSSDSGNAQPPSSTQPKQQNPPAHKSAAQENPFPQDVSEGAAEKQNQESQGQSSQSGTPEAATHDADPQSAQKPGDAAKENPFPEDVSKGAAAAANGNDSASSSSSSSSRGTDSDPDADVPPDTGRHRLKKPSDNDIQSGSLAGEGRAQEDVKVGRFYLGTGDYKGAYGRFSDATRMDPTNIDAIYGLAAAAEGLHRTDEALTNYKLYLEIAPDGSQAKSARKAIRSLAK